MPIKIKSFGGPIIWQFRKHNSKFTSSVMLTFASKKYKKTIDTYIKYFMGQKTVPVFKNCMIETLNRCNGICEFCPANKKDENRPYKKMSNELFYSIIHQLQDMRWNGKLYFGINNEPFLDKRILDFAKYAKKYLPGVRISVITNGTLLSSQKMDSMIGLIDELIINDYSANYTLSESHKTIYNHVKNNKFRFQAMNITINRRYSKEILATRAGNAPNKPTKNNNVNTPCIYPFLDLAIFPDGMIGMCCNDCKEISDFGNVTKKTLLEIWTNEKFLKLRNSMMKGRNIYPFCRECDVVDAGGREKQIKQLKKS